MTERTRPQITANEMDRHVVAMITAARDLGTMPGQQGARWRNIETELRVFRQLVRAEMSVEDREGTR
jgi:hypothetical protein